MSALLNPTSEVLAFMVCTLVGIHSPLSAISNEYIKYFSVIFVTAKLPKDAHLPFQRNVEKMSRRDEGDSLRQVIVLLSETHKRKVILKMLSHKLYFKVSKSITLYITVFRKHSKMADYYRHFGGFLFFSDVWHLF